jgi:signal transduction histidine kinase
VLKRLFDSFFTTKRDGMGLGLSIVHGFMLTQGGAVTAETPPEGGTRFVVSLPHSAHDHIPAEE